MIDRRGERAAGTTAEVFHEFVGDITGVQSSERCALGDAAESDKDKAVEIDYSADGEATAEDHLFAVGIDRGATGRSPMRDTLDGDAGGIVYTTAG